MEKRDREDREKRRVVWEPRIGRGTLPPQTQEKQ